MSTPFSAPCAWPAGRLHSQPIPAHFGSLAALLAAVREYSDSASPIRCAARCLELPAAPSSGPLQSIWGVLVTTRIPGTVARRGEAVLSAWIAAEELPRSAATRARREAAWAHLTDLLDHILAHIQASGFACQPGYDPVPITAFLCRAHFRAIGISPAITAPAQSAAALAIPHGAPDQDPS